MRLHGLDDTHRIMELTLKVALMRHAGTDKSRPDEYGALLDEAEAIRERRIRRERITEIIAADPVPYGGIAAERFTYEAAGAR